MAEPKQLLDRVRALPAARPLLGRLGDATGVHLVGGAVRDILLGGEPSDLDLVVEGDAQALVSRLGSGVRRHDRFGTSTVVIDGFSYDVALARRERYARPGALPEIAPASIADDLRRRDFTVNAAAISLGGPTAGELNAVPGALEDLDARVLRTLHERSFEDDPTRLLRLVRYASRLGFAVEPRTWAVATAAVQSGAVSTLSGARIGAELRLLAGEPDPIAALHGLEALGLDSAIHPELGLDQPDLARAALELLPEDGRRDLLVLAAMARRMQASQLSALLDQLEFDSSSRETIVSAAARSGEVANRLRVARAPSEIAAALAGGGPELAALAGALGPREAAAEWLERLRGVRLEIDGTDLVEAGIDPGPRIGRGLRAALDAKLDGRAEGREAELSEALRAARSTG